MQISIELNSLLINKIDSITFSLINAIAFKSQADVSGDNFNYENNDLGTENNGKKETAAWAKKLVANMARIPKGNDRAQILAVAAGEACREAAGEAFLRCPVPLLAYDPPEFSFA